MKAQTRFHKFSLGIGALALVALGSGTAFAEPHGGGHFGGEHFGGGGHFGGGDFGRVHPLVRGGDWHGDHGWHGGYGWHGPYGWYGPAWGGLALGLSFAALPAYYDTYWWGGVPYYYADGTYYSWEPNVGEYVTVAPPAGLQSQVAAQAPAEAQAPAGTQLMAYPEKGQTPEQQAADKTACQQWASQQASPNNPPDLARAESACLAGRGYSVE